MSTRIPYRTGMAHEGQTDATARCCGSFYYRYSSDTWFATSPPPLRMAEHVLNCRTCGADLVYVDGLERA